MIPTLETSRLLLRAHTSADFPAFAANRADPHVVRFLGKGDLLSEEDAWLRFQSIVGHWHLMGWGTWAVEEMSSGAYAGSIGFADKRRPPEHPASGAPEMGWLLAADAHGKGYATEAVRAALDWAAAHFGTGQRVVCVISTENAPSIRVAEKCGFRKFATASRYGRGRLVFKQSLPR
jgi:RimJ/RimL family protein N-acetyltransferase